MPQKALAGAYLVAYGLDWRQTTHAAHHPERYSERNPVLPKHPKVAQVNMVFLITAPVVLTAAHFAPTKLRTIILGLAAAAEITVTASNWRAGVKLHF